MKNISVAGAGGRVMEKYVQPGAKEQMRKMTTGRLAGKQYAGI